MVSLTYFDYFLFLLLLLFFFFTYLPSPNRGLTPHILTSQMSCRGNNSLWTRTLDWYTRASLPECVVSTVSGPPPETTQDRSDKGHTHPIPGQKWIFLTNRESNPGWKAGTLPTTPRRRILILIKQIFNYSRNNIIYRKK